MLGRLSSSEMLADVSTRECHLSVEHISVKYHIPTSVHICFPGSLDDVKCKHSPLTWADPIRAEPSGVRSACQQLQQMDGTLVRSCLSCEQSVMLMKASRLCTRQQTQILWLRLEWFHHGPKASQLDVCDCCLSILSSVASRLTDEPFCMTPNRQSWQASVASVVCHLRDELQTCPQITAEVFPRDCGDWTVCIIHLNS